MRAIRSSEASRLQTGCPSLVLPVGLMSVWLRNPITDTMRL